MQVVFVAAEEGAEDVGSDMCFSGSGATWEAFGLGL